MKIAITGGIGSGKSVVAAYLQKKGFPVFSADAVSRALTDSAAGVELVASRFPETVKEGVLDRKALASVVFSDPEKLKTLNGLLHPVIMRRLLEEMQEAETKGKPVFAEVPLLFESGSESLFDKIWIVRRDLNARVAAAAARDGVEEKEILCRIKNQTDYSVRDFSAHTIIGNDGTQEELFRRIDGEIAEIYQGV